MHALGVQITYSDYCSMPARLRDDYRLVSEGLAQRNTASTQIQLKERNELAAAIAAGTTTKAAT